MPALVLTAWASTQPAGAKALHDVLFPRYWVEVVRGETVQAQAKGASGVPAWVIDQRALVPGAQPHELFERILEKLGHEAAA